MCSHQRLGDLQKLQVSAVFGRSRSESTGSINTNESKGRISTGGRRRREPEQGPAEQDYTDALCPYQMHIVSN